MARSLFAHACAHCAVLVDGAQVELVYRAGVPILSYTEPTKRPEFIELTPRVRLGLWLAEDEYRDWHTTEAGGKVRLSLLLRVQGEPEILAIGTGPDLDAAIEDALAKVGK